MNVSRLSLVFAGVLATLAALAARAQGFSSDNVQFWAGTGSNYALLVIDWNNGNPAQSLLWGYRWNGTATGMDMLKALAGTGIVRVSNAYRVNPGAFVESFSGADARLYARLSTWGDATTLFGLGYDADNDGGGFVSGLEGLYGTETGHANDPADFFAEGWLANPSWNYVVFKPGMGDVNKDDAVNLADFSLLKANFNGSGVGWNGGDLNYDGKVDLADFSLLKASFGTSGTGTWIYSPVPFYARTLASGDRDAWIYDGGMIGNVPHVPVAAGAPQAGMMSVPEPVSLAILALAPAILPRRRT